MRSGRRRDRARGVAVAAAARVVPQHSGGVGRGVELPDRVRHADAADGNLGPVARVAVDRARGGKDSAAARGEEARVERVAVAVHHLVLCRRAVVERVRERDRGLSFHEGAGVHARRAKRRWASWLTGP